MTRVGQAPRPESELQLPIDVLPERLQKAMSSVPGQELLEIVDKTNNRGQGPGGQCRADDGGVRGVKELSERWSQKDRSEGQFGGPYRRMPGRVTWGKGSGALERNEGELRRVGGGRELMESKPVWGIASSEQVEEASARPWRVASSWARTHPPKSPDWGQAPRAASEIEPGRRHEGGEFADELEGSEEEVCGAVGGGTFHPPGEPPVVAKGEPLE